LSQLDKLINRILTLDKSLRFDEVSKVLTKIGYIRNQPKGGSSHYIFRAKGLPPISIPKNNSVKMVYIELVRDAIIKHIGGGEQQ